LNRQRCAWRCSLPPAPSSVCPKPRLGIPRAALPGRLTCRWLRWRPLSRLPR